MKIIEAAFEVLRTSGTWMKTEEICAAAQKQRLIESSGATPKQSFSKELHKYVRQCKDTGATCSITKGQNAASWKWVGDAPKKKSSRKRVASTRLKELPADNAPQRKSTRKRVPSNKLKQTLDEDGNDAPAEAAAAKPSRKRRRDAETRVERTSQLEVEALLEEASEEPPTVRGVAKRIDPPASPENSDDPGLDPQKRHTRRGRKRLGRRAAAKDVDYTEDGQASATEEYDPSPRKSKGKGKGKGKEPKTVFETVIHPPEEAVVDGDFVTFKWGKRVLPGIARGTLMKREINRKTEIEVEYMNIEVPQPNGGALAKSGTYLVVELEPITNDNSVPVMGNDRYMCSAWGGFLTAQGALKPTEIIAREKRADVFTHRVDYLNGKLWDDKEAQLDFEGASPRKRRGALVRDDSGMSVPKQDMKAHAQRILSGQVAASDAEIKFYREQFPNFGV